MFSALRPAAKCAFWPKNGPVPARPVNGYARERLRKPAPLNSSKHGRARVKRLPSQA